ncbi:rRNA maturation RNase YbeY [Patescibacteria group bacterium]|nr:rRNA maturation RNase YbeY [Patescibacteria group bacterium]
MIEINNLTTSEIDENFVKGVAKKVLKGENRKEIDLSIVFVGEARMRKLNKKYRNKNKVTDVLSFGDELNEIVVCLREIKKNAKTYNSTFKKELARVLTHGIKNICQSNT